MRFAFTVTLLIITLIFPWWVTTLGVTVGFVFFSRYSEGLFILLLVDVMSGSRIPWLALFGAVVFLGLYFGRRQLRMSSIEE